MNVATDVRGGTTTIVAPAAGRLRLHPPAALCGELEVFDAGEVLASIDAVAVSAPASGFVLRALVADGAAVDAGAPILEYREA